MKKKSKAWSEEVIDTLINCFRQMNAYGILSVVIIKEGQSKKFLDLEEAYMSMQEYDMNRYEY